MEIISDEQARPAHGRVRVTDRIGSDYVFAPSAGADLGSMFLETGQQLRALMPCNTVRCAESYRNRRPSVSDDPERH